MHTYDGPYRYCTCTIKGAAAATRVQQSECGKFFTLANQSEAAAVLKANQNLIADPEKVQRALVAAAKAAVAETETTRRMLRVDLNRIEVALAKLPDTPRGNRISVQRTPIEVSRRRLTQSKAFLKKDLASAQHRVAQALELYKLQASKLKDRFQQPNVQQSSGGSAGGGSAGGGGGSAGGAGGSVGSAGWAAVRSWFTTMLSDHDTLSSLVRQGAEAKNAIGEAVINRDDDALKAADRRFTAALNAAAAEISPRLATANHRYEGDIHDSSTTFLVNSRTLMAHHISVLSRE